MNYICHYVIGSFIIYVITLLPTSPLTCQAGVSPYTPTPRATHACSDKKVPEGLALPSARKETGNSRLTLLRIERRL
jgi:hypothetical protein